MIHWFGVILALSAAFAWGNYLGKRKGYSDGYLSRRDKT